LVKTLSARRALKSLLLTVINLWGDYQLSPIQPQQTLPSVQSSTSSAFDDSRVGMRLGEQLDEGLSDAILNF